MLDGEPGGPFEVRARAFAGEPVEYALRDPRSGRLVASVTSAFHGPKIWFADDPAGEWQQADGVALPPGGDAALARVWLIVAARASASFTRRRPRGCSRATTRESWSSPRAVETPRSVLAPVAGGCACTRVPWPGDVDRLAPPRSRAGVCCPTTVSRRGGAAQGHAPRYIPEGCARRPRTCACITSRARRFSPSGSHAVPAAVLTLDMAAEWTDSPGAAVGLRLSTVRRPPRPDSAYVIPLTAGPTA